MRIFTLCALFGIFIPCTAPAGGRMLKGRVLLLGKYDQKTPAIGLNVVVKGGGDTTDSHGQFQIFLDEKVKPGQSVELLVHKTGWRIYQPLDGKITIPAEPDKQTITILLLPIKSKRFLTDAQIEQSQRTRIAALRTRSFPGEVSLTVDFEQYVKEEAAKHGLSALEVKSKIDKWVAEVEKKQDDQEKLGLAAFATGDHIRASKLLSEAATQADEKAASRLHDTAEDRAEAIRRHQLAGNMAFNNKEYETALAHYERALRNASRRDEPQQWATLMTHAADAHARMGDLTLGPASSEHLEAAKGGYRSALKVYTAERSPREWSLAQEGMAEVLMHQGSRASGAEAMRLLRDAVGAYRLVLRTITPDQFPWLWCKTQNALGNALVVQADYVGDEEHLGLLREAEQAYRAALQVGTRKLLPNEWASMQGSMGRVLVSQGTKLGGEKAVRLLRESEQAFRAALEVFTRERYPLEWVQTQSALGVVLCAQADTESDEEGVKLLRAAAQTQRMALEVDVRERDPHLWTKTRRALGDTLRELGSRLEGSEAVALLRESEQVYRAILEVYSRDQTPAEWASTQFGLGHSLGEQGEKVGGAAGIEILRKAEQAYRAALEVYTRELFPEMWAQAQNNMGVVLRKHAERVGGTEALVLLREAERAYRAVLEVFTPERSPRKWSTVHGNLLWVQVAMAEFHVAAGSFAEMERVLSEALSSPDLTAANAINLRTLELVSLLALGRLDIVPARIETLRGAVASRADAISNSWRRQGIRERVRQDRRLAPFRGWLPLLVEAVGNRDQKATLAALDEARKSLSRNVYQFR